jgi:hypothetical protein
VEPSDYESLEPGSRYRETGRTDDAERTCTRS